MPTTTESALIEVGIPIFSGTDDRRADALAAGKKRSVKDRLGVRKGGGGGGDGHGMHRHHDVVTGEVHIWED